jgi:hypothetical protein
MERRLSRSTRLYPNLLHTLGYRRVLPKKELACLLTRFLGILRDYLSFIYLLALQLALVLIPCFNAP